MDKNIVKTLKAQVNKLNKALIRATDPRGTKAHDNDPKGQTIGKRKKSKIARATYPGGTKAYDKKYGNK
jgi:hypothetical protein